MHGLSPETKHKLMRALPWIIGGGLLLFLLLKSRSSSARTAGSAPVQDLSQLGGGSSAPVTQQSAVVPGDVAAQIGQQWGSSREKFMALRQSIQAANPPNVGPGTLVAALSGGDMAFMAAPKAPQASHLGFFDRIGRELSRGFQRFAAPLALTAGSVYAGGAPITAGTVSTVALGGSVTQKRATKPAANGAQRPTAPSGWSVV